MRRQALLIRKWGRNVFVKVPVTNTRGESTAGLVADLAAEGVRLNVTALLTLDQVRTVAAALNPAVPSVVSVFAGRVADTGVDPEPLMRAAKEALAPNPSVELLWASVREVFNIHQAVRCGTPIVTVTHDILAKAIQMDGRELGALSLDTVKMFRNDAVASGFSL
jgi:transaldolase